MRGAAIAALASTALALTATAFAQTAPEGDALLRQGVALREAGHDDEAVDVFHRAWDGTHRPVALAQWGLAEQAVGRWLAAEAHVRAAIAIRGDAWIERNRADIEAAYGVILQHVGQLDVRGGVPGAQVTVNGQPAGTLPMAEPVRVVVGTTTLEVSAPGYEPFTREVTVEPGAIATERVELRAVAPETVVTAPVAPAPVEARHGHDGVHVQRILAWSAFGAAAVMLVGGFAALGARSAAVGQYNADALCPGTQGDAQPAPCDAWLATGRTALPLEVVGFVAAGVFAAGGAVLFVMAPRGAASRRTAARAWCVPWAASDAAGAACGLAY